MRAQWKVGSVVLTTLLYIISVSQASLNRNQIQFVHEYSLRNKHQTVYNDDRERHFHTKVDLKKPGIPEEGKNSYKEIKQLVHRLVSSFSTNLPAFSRATEELVLKLTKRFIYHLEALGVDFTNATEELVRELYGIVQEQILQLKDELEMLQQKVDSQLEWAMTQMNETLMNHTETFDVWSARVKHALRNANSTLVYQKSCEVIDDFVKQTTHELERCCSITMSPIRSVCRSSESVIMEMVRLLVDVLDRMQLCLEDKNSYLDFMLPCISLAFEDASAIMAKAWQLRHKIASMLPVKILYSRGCLSIALVRIETRRAQLEDALLPPRRYG